MLGKILFATGICFVGKHFHDVLALSDEEKHYAKIVASSKVAHALAGKVVKSAGGTTLYYLWGKGSRVEYVSQQAYINHGSKEIVIVTQETLDHMGLITNAKIYEDGFKWDIE